MAASDAAKAPISIEIVSQMDRDAAALRALSAAALAWVITSEIRFSASAGDKVGPLWVEYDRFVRDESPTSLVVHLGPNAAPGGEARVWVSRDYLEAVQLDSVVPAPERVEAGADRHTYVFRLSDPSRPTAAVFRFHMERAGRRTLGVGLAGGPEVRCGQFAYP